MQYFYVVFEQTMEIDEGVTQMKSVKKFKETIAIIRGQPTGIFVTKLEMINYMGVEIEVANRCTYTIT